MAATTTVAGRITGTGFTSGNPVNIVDFIVKYHVASDAGLVGPAEGEVAVKADILQNDTQITQDIRAALAAYLNTQLTPNPALAANNVRGCNL